VKEDTREEGEKVSGRESLTEGPQRISVTGRDHPIVEKKLLEDIPREGKFHQEDDPIYQDDQPGDKRTLSVRYIILYGKHLYP